MSEFLARIRPGSKREKQVVEGRTFEKSRGWYGPIPEALAKKLQGIPENDLNPAASQPVFEVREKAAAKAVQEQEQRVEKPRGTVEKPTPPAEPMVEAGKRSHAATDVDASAKPSPPTRRRRRS